MIIPGELKFTEAVAEEIPIKTIKKTSLELTTLNFFRNACILGILLTINERINGIITINKILISMSTKDTETLAPKKS
jgi:hypothetical protein